MAAGTVLIFYGFTFSLWFTVLGAVMFACAVAGWIGEIRHEHH
jgi:hypothetical protein